MKLGKLVATGFALSLLAASALAQTITFRFNDPEDPECARRSTNSRR